MREGLSELVLTPVETDADLEDLIGVRCRPSASGDLQLEVERATTSRGGFSSDAASPRSALRRRWSSSLAGRN